jgi:hypothetical protein
MPQLKKIIPNVLLYSQFSFGCAVSCLSRKIDERVKSQFSHFPVIPAKAGHAVKL